ncbi:MAG: diguanylate cyclase [Nitrospirae bacterium]|nr:diguanylate cyclase [Nitrospirota bacterium]
MRSIAVITEDASLKTLLLSLLEESYRLSCFSSIQASLDYIYNSMPDLLIIASDLREEFPVRLLNDLKDDPIFGQVPVVLVVSEGLPAEALNRLPIDDYVSLGLIETDLRIRIDLCIKRAERVVEVNPLTRLPGNIAIIKQIQGRLDKGEAFSLAYADLDYFKPFNDNYGFSRGDEVLKMSGRLMLNIVRNRQPCNSFVGHIGGDDFVFIMDAARMEDTALEIMENFDRIIPTFYEPGDRAKRGIDSVDRDGSRRSFPFISLSVGIASTKTRLFSHYGEISEVASEMKKYAKKFSGSCCKVDLRTQ